MEFLGIKFAPFSVPLKRRFETLAAASWFFIMVTCGSYLTYLLALLIIIYTNYWLECIVYLIWSYTIDKNTSEYGGRKVEWVRNWIWWKYFKSYFPIRLVKAADVELNPKRNYLFCSIPHGMLASGCFSVFGTNYSEFKELFPYHSPHILTLKQHFHKPFFKDLLYSLGMCSSSKQSMNWLLQYPEGGKVAVLIVGGVAEAYYCKPGIYKTVINKRKGFVRVAMQSGSAIVPIISFGETSVFGQLNNPKGSILRKMQDICKKFTGVAPIIPLGRGIFQYTFGMVPHRKPITVLVGKPMDVPKIENPSNEEVNAVHAQFLIHLTALFEMEKQKYVDNPETTYLEFDDN